MCVGYSEIHEGMSGGPVRCYFTISKCHRKHTLNTRCTMSLYTCIYMLHLSPLPPLYTPQNLSLCFTSVFNSMTILISRYFYHLFLFFFNDACTPEISNRCVLCFCFSTNKQYHKVLFFIMREKNVFQRVNCILFLCCKYLFIFIFISFFLCIILKDSQQTFEHEKRSFKRYKSRVIRDYSDSGYLKVTRLKKKDRTRWILQLRKWRIIFYF